ncbi:MAG: hypothetical protein AAF228_05445 [Pseudomonadota bacterium]
MEQEPIHFAGSVHPKELEAARQYVHHALQWLARICYHCSPKGSDQDETPLLWVPNDSKFVTQALVELSGIHFGLQVPTLTLFAKDNTGTMNTLSLDGQSESDILDWMSSVLKESHFKTDVLLEPLPYSLPAHKLDEDAMYDAIDTALELRELALWYDYGYTILKLLQDENTSHTKRISDIRCSPRDLSLTTTLQFHHTQDKSGDAKVHLGFSPGDEHYSEPYFFVTHWPYLEPRRLPELPFIGKWHVQGSVRAIALSSRLYAIDNNDKLLLAFFRETIESGNALR